MLVLSRRLNEKVVFPHLGISVEVLRVNKDRVRLGIEAPESVQILRGEICGGSLPAPLNIPPIDTMMLLTSFSAQLRELISKLYELHDLLLGKEDVKDAEPLIYKLFLELKSMDDAIAGRMKVVSQRLLRPPSKKMALVVEDNLNEARLLASYLKFRNFDVEIAGNGKVAMNYLESHKSPDCVLLDMGMPPLMVDGPWKRSVRRPV
ncbi:MAG: carbon storage regulator [Planctomycetaceae bacterium]